MKKIFEEERSFDLRAWDEEDGRAWDDQVRSLVDAHYDKNVGVLVVDCSAVRKVYASYVVLPTQRHLLTAPTASSALRAIVDLADRWHTQSLRRVQELNAEAEKEIAEGQKKRATWAAEQKASSAQDSSPEAF